MSDLSRTVIAFLLVTGSVALIAQESPPRVEFDVVSIKRSTSGELGNSIRTLPDGTYTATNTPIASIIRLASPISLPGHEVIGLPDWTRSERYDVTMKPPEGVRPNPDQRRQMWQAAFADRMKFAAHVEERDRDTYALVLARSDGKLGPQLKPSTLDCTARPSPPPSPTTSFNDFANRCGLAGNPRTLLSGGVTMEMLALNLGGRVDTRVYNRTSLEGAYAVKLDFRSEGSATASAPTSSAVPERTKAADLDSTLPDILTALEEQLGLRLQRQRTKEPVLVIDHIERPSEN
jgi:uncharacterized protein (TIGR03435 family)